MLWSPRVRACVAMAALAPALLVIGTASPAAAAAPRTCFLFCSPPTTAPPTTLPPSPAPAVPPAPAVAAPELPALAPGGEAPAAAERLLELVNAERAKTGAAPLAVHEPARVIAVRWSHAMSAAGSISHNDAYFSSATRKALGASALGENVAIDNRVDDAHDNLMQSAGHRANILDRRFNAIGIGVVANGAGVYFITQNFLQTSRIVAPSAAAPTPRKSATARPPARAAANVAPPKPVAPALPKTPARSVTPAAPEVRPPEAVELPVTPKPGVATIATTPVATGGARRSSALPIVAGAALVALVTALMLSPSRDGRRRIQSTSRNPEGAIDSDPSLGSSTTNSLR